MANAFETLKNMSNRGNDDGIYMKSESTLIDQITRPVKMPGLPAGNNPNVMPARMPNPFADPTQTPNRLPDPRSDEFMNIIEEILKARSSSVAYMTTSAFGTMSGMENPNDLSLPKNPYINI